MRMRCARAWARVAWHSSNPNPNPHPNTNQVAFADRLLLNKIDLVPDEASLLHVEARLRLL